MATTHRVKLGSRLPTLRVTLQQGDGTAVPGTLSSCRFRMRSRRTNAVKIDLAACTIVDASAKIVEYAWAATDVDTAGKFDAEFVATIDGKPCIFPAAGADEEDSLVIEVTRPLT